MSKIVKKDIDGMFDRHPEFKGVMSKKNWEYLALSNDQTLGYFVNIWKDHMRKNIKRGLLKKHKMLADDCIGLGKNKAVVCIGAGPSLNKNRHVLRQIYEYDSKKPWNERNFIFVASNHMYKPLLKEGFIPDFAILVDAGDIALEQLTDDIPPEGQDVTLLAGLQCSPKILKRWSNQGRAIRFYITQSEGLPETYREETGDDPVRVQAAQGGNVLNMAWSLSMRFLRSTVFMVVGNDLSYPIHDDIEERRKTYYADKDYSSNLKNRRDEASNLFEGNMQGWLGLTMEKSKILSPNARERYNIELEPVLTTGTLWVYKTWMESVVLANSKIQKFHYYNCSEGGIAGVMCKEDSDMDDVDSWFLLDDKCPRWKTRMLEDAADDFLTARRAMQWQTTPDAQNVISSAVRG